MPLPWIRNSEKLSHSPTLLYTAQHGVCDWRRYNSGPTRRRSGERAISTITNLNGAAACRVSAPARLHLGFLDPDASLGRRFGSIGMAVSGIETVVTVRRASRFGLEGEEADRASVLACRFREALALPPVAVTVERAIPAHAGLGSGTQLALAVGTAIAAVGGHHIDARGVGHTLERGQRSGIGLAVFERGGFVVDAGRGTASEDPPPVSRLPVPPAWRVVLLFDRRTTGVSGTAERDAFQRLTPLPRERAAHLCHLVLLQLLPALAEADFDPFAAAVGEIQAINGDYFAPAQGGRRYISADLARAVGYCSEQLGQRGVGQSSWGPTAFVFTPSEERARDVVAALRDAGVLGAGLEALICAARNEGAVIEPAGAGAQGRRAPARG